MKYIKNLNYKKRNKNAFSFFYMLFIFILIVGIFNYIFFINDQESKPNSYKVSETLNKVIQLKEEYYIYDTFYKNSFNILISNIERNFIIDYFKKNINDNNLGADCIDSNSNLIFFNEVGNNNCLFGNDVKVKKEFEIYLNSNINNKIPDKFIYKIDKSNEFKLNFEKEDEKTISASKLITKAKVKYNYEYNINLKKEEFILKELKNIFDNNNNLNDLKQKIADEYPKCINDPNKKKEKCYENIILGFLKDKKINLQQKGLKLSIEEYPFYQDPDSFALKFIFNSINDDYFFIDFLVILKKFKNPMINFNLYEGDLNIQENNIKVEVIKDNSNPDFESLYVFYSYEDLKKKEIDINNLKELDTNLKIGYFENNPKISYFKIENPKYDLDISDSKFKNISYIYQIYNNDNSNLKFDLLEDNTELYVSVVGVKKGPNPAEFKLINIKKINIKRNELKGKPLPLIKSVGILSGNFEVKLEPKTSNFIIDINNYNDLNFNHYDFYLIEENSGFDIKDCSTTNPNNCYIYEGKQSLNLKNQKILITDMSNYNNINKYDLVLKGTNFNPNVDFLINKYKFYIIPKDDKDEGIFEDIKKPFELEYDSSTKTYKIKTGPEEILRISSVRLKFS